MLSAIRNKRGSEMVEAAVVLPLLLLSIISVIYLGLFYYAAFSDQLEAQRSVLDEAEGSNALFSIVSGESDTSLSSRGLYVNGFHKSKSYRVYVINTELVIRGGEVLGLQ